jgi:hypothetical protein
MNVDKPPGYKTDCFYRHRNINKPNSAIASETTVAGSGIIVML